MATAADRALFAYDTNAPLNLQKTVESTTNGVEVSAISFNSPDGGLVTGLLFDPVYRSGPRPGIVLMHGMPGSSRSMAGHGQGLAAHGAVVIAIDAPFDRVDGLKRLPRWEEGRRAASALGLGRFVVPDAGRTLADQGLVPHFGRAGGVFPRPADQPIDREE